METALTEDTNGIAIIGMSCRFPKAKTPEQFWKNLEGGLECVTEFSKDDLKAGGIDPAILNYPAYVNKGIVLEDIDRFDAVFFGFSPREAEIIDPQHRMFLECAWEALENAGYDPDSYKGLIGVYGGVDSSRYLLNIYANPDVLQSVGLYTITLHNDKDTFTSRVSYKLNLKGPAITVQTTCSTSLVAIIQACQGLLNYQCDIAMAGGAAIILPQKMGYFYQEGGISSPDGHCRAFDAQARGTTGGSGSGIVVLKRLEDALKDGDHIEAIIRGFGINNDGSDKVGYTAPSMNGQAEAITSALAMADINADSISYVEAHGTGTSVGDPIEVGALTEAFRRTTYKKGFCGIGSVKTNIGHCNSAAGVAGFIKTVMSLKNKMLAPSLNFKYPNPNIDFANSPFYVVNSLRAWDTDNKPRRAGVSSFGIGGTNAHMILEEAPDSGPADASRDWQLMLLSAKTNDALDRLTSNLLDHLRIDRKACLSDIAYTLQVGRKRFPKRKMLLLPNNDPSALDDILNKSIDAMAVTNDSEDKKSVVFMFSGQGSQYVNMASGLYSSEPLFREIVDHCCEQLKEDLGIDLRQIIYSDNPDAAEELKQTQFAQPALFVIEYALAKLWMSWGITPDVMIGHSIGELTAACISGVFSLEDALTVVAHRGKLMQSMPRGCMQVVYAPRKDVLPLLKEDVSIAAINTPDSCVISGTFAAVETMDELLRQRQIAFHPLNTSHAFHSQMMDKIIDSFAKRLESVRLSDPKIPFISNITGRLISAEMATDPSYWGKHIRSTVLYSEGLSQLLQDPSHVYIEVGPGNSLCTILNQHLLKPDPETVLPSLPHPRDNQPDEKILLSTVGKLWLNGAEIDWQSFYQYEKRHRIALPTYPFNGERYWIDPSGKTNGQVAADQRKTEISQWLYVPCWKMTQLPSEEYSDNLVDIGPVLLLLEKGRRTDALLKESFGKKNTTIYSVLQSDTFKRIDENTFCIDPASSEHYSKLLSELQANGALPDTIIHMWSFTEKNETPKYAQSANGFTSLLFLAQAVSNNNITKPVKLKVITNRMYQLHEFETIEPEKMMITGACKVIGQEYPGISCQCIDVDNIGFQEGPDHSLAGQMLGEFAFSSPDKNILYRNGKRWAQSFKPADLPPQVLSRSLLRMGGAYLITGGLGGIGLALARYIGKKYKAKIVLTGRSPFPAEDSWAAWLETHPAGDTMSEKIRQLMQLKEIGAEVLVVNADVSDLLQIKKLGDQIRQRFGTLNGIVHSAGVAGGGIIAVKKELAAQKVMDPKVKGTLNLDQVFGGGSLDFFVLCSSLSAIVGGVGQIDYCAANNFLDAFAHHKNKRFGTRYVSINWDTWAEVGMAVNTEVPEELKAGQQEALRMGIRNEEGVEAFERILTGYFPQVLTSTSELLPRIKRIASHQLVQPLAEEHKKGDSRAATHERPNLSTEFEPATTPSEIKLTEIWMELLGIKKIGINDNFLELGGHSLLAIQLTSRLRSTFGLEYSMQSFFESPTIKSLASVIDKQKENNEAGQKTDKPALVKLSRDNYRVEI